MYKIILTPFILLFSFNLLACDCLVSTIEEIIPTTELIIRGKFIKVEKEYNVPSLPEESNKTKLYYEGSIIITEVIKGKGIPVGDTIAVKSDFSDCSNLYSMATEYLFFATKQKSGIKSNGVCSFTTELRNLKEDEWYNRTKKYYEKR